MLDERPEAPVVMAQLRAGATDYLLMQRTIAQRFQSIGSTSAVAMVVILFAFVVGVDLLTGSELSFSLFYLVPVALVSFRWGIASGQGAAFGAALAWFAVDLVSGNRYSNHLIPLWNASVRFGFFSLVSWLLDNLHRAVERETALARTDPLTGLPNRRAFGEMAARELARSERLGSGVALVAIDLDDFKLVNDRRGHEGGDEVLCQFATTARRVLRSVDITGRSGGDEFAVLLPDVDPAAALAAMDRFQEALTSSEVGPIGCSMGVAYVIGGVVSDALRSADAALYRAKAAGKGTIMLSDLVCALELDLRSTGAEPVQRYSHRHPIGESTNVVLPDSEIEVPVPSGS